MKPVRAHIAYLSVIGLLAVGFLVMTVQSLSFLSQESNKLIERKLQAQSLNYQLDSLAASKKEIAQYSYFKTIAKTVIPNDKNQAAAVLEIQSLADQAGISIATITFPSSTLGAHSDATSATSTQNLITQAKPVSGIAGLYSLQLTVTPQTGSQVPADKQVTYAKMLDFLSRIEKDRHTAQVSQIDIQPLESGYVNFTLVINIFIKP